MGEMYAKVVTTSDAGAYKCNAINSAGTSSSDQLTLTVNSPAPDVPTITGWPVGSSASIGSVLSLECNDAVTGGVPTFFEWYLGQIKLTSTGDREKVYTKTVTVTDGGSYSCLAINAQGYATSMTYNFTVNNPPSNPIISGWPAGSELNVGETLSITCRASASGGTPTSFEVYHDGTLLSSTGTRGEIYTKVMTISDGGDYMCKAINADGAAETNDTLIVKDPPHMPTIYGWPNGSVIIASETLDLRCDAAVTGGTPVSFQWYLGATLLSSTGASGESYTKEAVLDDAGAHKCVAINADGQAESYTQFLAVQNPTFDVGFSLSTPFSSDLNDPASSAFLSLASDMAALLNSSLSGGDTPVKEINIKGFR
ncbi:basement membrane-specific heparan sulfate proteoglycan core protein-like [Lineus longissimus]|uniref:basement membrane-specific heparan sulfate proteoglycan core protein-like n=1 Tax=Lineus longissimus TaxID=88925 RepID=UPI00315D51E8